ncbi:MAG: protease modulator HflC [Candidatus Marinimicrobia bacterium]|jgi:membrane protease subunit HflC|nr:protease modulator HflC [Candidatus Neomarinimicrobiota bacterium]MBT5721851.1 protease modulator HflC [Candidatus Neomarinimicrobiota bacterium]MBT7520278.1 protease modulator HflC [Candidatus Neomarinimicrobiota bacterium]
MKRFSIAIFSLVILFVLSTIIVVDETEQVVILQFGKPVQTITDPGLNFKFPAPIQVSNSFDKRLLEYDVPPEEILSRDKKSLIIDNYVRWRIVDPLLFLQTVRAIPTAKTRLDDIVYSELRQELGNHDMAEIITETRELIMEKVTIASNEETSKYGIEVIDVRIRRVDLPQQNEASIYARMEAERKRQANKFRSEGEEEAQKIRAATDRDKTIILAEAYKTSQQIRGEGEAEALDIYAESFSKDPDFYEFLRTLETYEKVIDKKTTLVLPGDSKLFKALTQ